MMKIDLQKAYDTVEWGFVKEMLDALGFPSEFISRVMECITTPSYSISLNGGVFGHFKGRRGLRQGDPLSPLLFTLCMEYLSRLLMGAQDKQEFKYHSLCKRLSLSHLCFADDLLMFCHGDLGSVKVMLNAFDSFSQATGLQMNVDKSNVYMNGVDAMVRGHILEATGMVPAKLPFRYLGVPISAKKLSVLDCAVLVERVVERIRALGARKLSYGGRLVCMPKKYGGLGLINAGMWNIAAMGKYVWWIMNKKDHLWVKWVHAIYIKGKDWLNYSPTTTASWSWKQLCKVKETLKGGYNGNSWISLDQSYTIRDGYHWLLPNGSEMIWHHMVWSRIGPGKINFIAWLAVQSRLMTRDRLIRWVPGESGCLLCGLMDESHTHLFFSCAFSCRCLKLVSDWLGVDIPGQNTVSWWLNMRCRSMLLKKITGASICSLFYHVWFARNRCLHDQVLMLPKVVFQTIKNVICTRVRKVVSSKVQVKNAQLIGKLMS
ncbi:uncharacterized protein LOC141631711 [Silene latifolia]|uniref:uncharacterized protein LOC141631711 n=1 Tax=Silene latifolia TaxID=37657 RepID=UPI003D780FEF